MSNIKRIVLTGGPCAGKTTALVRIIEHFQALCEEPEGTADEDTVGVHVFQSCAIQRAIL